MKCSDAIHVMEKLQAGKEAKTQLNSTEKSQVQDLIKAGYILEVDPPELDTGRLTMLKVKLAELQKRIQPLKASVSRLTIKEKTKPLVKGSEQLERNEAELGILLQEEREVRDEILALSAKSAVIAGSTRVNGNNYALSYKGKEFLSNIQPRLKRFRDQPMDAFEQEVQVLKTSFEGQAARAYKILKKISPKLKKIDEIHLRSAGLGLAIRPEPFTEIASAFVEAVESLLVLGIKDDRRTLAAESIVLNAGDLTGDEIRFSASRFSELYTRVAAVTISAKDALHCALLLFPLKITAEETIKTMKEASEAAPQIYPASTASKRSSKKKREVGPGISEYHLAPLVLLSRAGFLDDNPSKQRFLDYFQKLQPLSDDVRDAAYSAALLATAKGEPAFYLDRIKLADDYLGRFTEEKLLLPATTICLLKTDVEETFDTLRLASSIVSKHKLSLGGEENLSLGAKLLLQTCIAARRQQLTGTATKYRIFPETGFIPPSLEILAFTDIPIGTEEFGRLPEFRSFEATTMRTVHHRTYHRRAFYHRRFHPVHRHYIYG